MANGLATYIGYEAVNPTDFSKIQEEFQKNQAALQKQNLKQEDKKIKSYNNAQAGIYDFSNKIDQNLSGFIAQAVNDGRNALFFENTNNTGKSAAEVQMFNNNLQNDFAAYKMFCETYEQNFATFTERENLNPKTEIPFAGPLESQYFAKKYANQSDFSHQKAIYDKNGRMYINTVDDNGNAIGNSTPAAVNNIINIKNYQSDNANANMFVSSFTDNLKPMRTAYEQAAVGKGGVMMNVTLEGLANKYNTMNPGAAKDFKEMYNGIVTSAYKSVTAQPNVAANVLMNSGTEEFFVYEEGVTSGQFALGNRDKKLGIKMVVNSAGQMQADLSDYQNDLLKNAIQDNIDRQIGFKNTQDTDRGSLKRASSAKRRHMDLDLALKMRAGIPDAWDQSIAYYNNSIGLKADDKIVSYRVSPERVTTVNAIGQEVDYNIGEFTGDVADKDNIYRDLGQMFGILDRKAYGTSAKAMEGVQDAIDGLEPSFAADLGLYEYQGTRGKAIDIDEKDYQGLVNALSYEPPSAGGPSETTVGDNVGDFITNLNEIINFDPVKKVAGKSGGVATGATSGTGGSIINSVKMYNVNSANTPVNTISLSGSQLDDKGAFISAYAANPNSNPFQAQTRANYSTNTTGKNYIEIDVKGGPDGTDTRTFKFQLFPGNNINPQVFDKQNKEEYMQLINFSREPTRTKSQYYGPTRASQPFSTNYDAAVFNL